METLGLAFDWGLMINSGLSSETMETTLNARAGFTRRLYTIKWW